MDESHAPAPSKVGYGPLVAVVMTVVFFFAAQILAGLILSLLPLVTNLSTQDVTVWLQASVWAKFIALGLVGAIELFLIGQFLGLVKSKWRQIGLVKPAVRDVWLTVGGYVVYLSLFLLLSQVVTRMLPGLNLDQRQQVAFDRPTGGLGLLPIYVGIVLVPAITEEILFRGFLYSGLRRGLKLWPAALITSLIFAIPHLQFETGHALLWVAAIDTFVMSLILVVLRERSGSLWPPMLIHALKNSIAFVFLFLIPH